MPPASTSGPADSGVGAALFDGALVGPAVVAGALGVGLSGGRIGGGVRARGDDQHDQRQRHGAALHLLPPLDNGGRDGRTGRPARTIPVQSRREGKPLAYRVRFYGATIWIGTFTPGARGGKPSL